MSYYQPGMTPEQQTALAATLPQDTRKALLAKGLSLLPSCRSEDFENCIAGKWNATSYPECPAVNDGWTGDYDAMEKAVEAIPYCAEPVSTAKLVGGALVAFTVGLGVGVLVMK